MPEPSPETTTKSPGSNAALDSSAEGVASTSRRFDMTLLLSVLLYFGFLTTLWGLYRVGSPTWVRATVYDTLAKPGDEVELLVKFEHEGPGLFDRDLAGVEVRVGLSEDQLTSAQTDDEGVARLRLTAPSRPGTYPVRATTVDPEYTLLSAQPAGLTVVGKPLLVCDIDDTVTEGEGWKLFVDGKEPTPSPSAARVLGDLAGPYQLVFLTARDDSLLEDTRRWLARHGFPAAPVVGRDWGVFSPFTTGEDKRKILSQWKQRFGEIPWGIGNSSGDLEAYRHNGIEHIIFVEDEGRANEGSGSDETRSHFVVRSSSSGGGWTQVADIVASKSRESSDPSAGRDSGDGRDPEDGPNPGD